jgi:hypothetical protein
VTRTGVSHAQIGSAPILIGCIGLNAYVTITRDPSAPKLGIVAYDIGSVCDPHYPRSDVSTCPPDVLTMSP